MSGPPLLAIVIAASDAPVLVNEAIETALSQDTPHGYVVVAADAGSCDLETRDALAGWRVLYPDRFHAILLPRRSDAAAFNAGVAYALDAFPAVEAIFLLGAEDRLEPGAVRVLARALFLEPRSDWFIPPIDLFGFDGSFTGSGDLGLACGAASPCRLGALIRRRVFEAGPRFDEAMPPGPANRDFWLKCAQAGFRGSALRQSVLRRRRRAIATSCPAPGDPAARNSPREESWMAAPWAAEAPRYLAWFPETERAVAFTDPDSVEPWDRALLERRLYATLADEHENSFPSIWIAASEPAWSALREAGLLRFALHDLERRVDAADIASLSLRSGAEGRHSYGPPLSAQPAAETRVVMVAASQAVVGAIMREPFGAQMIEGIAQSALDASAGASLALPPAHRGAVRGCANPLAAFGRLLGELRESRYSTAGRLAWRPLGEIASVSDAAEAAPVVGIRYAAQKSTDRIDVGFALPYFDFGGVEKVAAAVAAEMRRSGFRTHLFLIGDQPIAGSALMRAAFDTLNRFQSPGMFEFSGPHYLGARTSGWKPAPRARGELLESLAWLDVLINAQASALNEVMAEVRARGVLAVAHEHVIERSPYGRPYGPPHIALAYEPAYDLIAACSADLGHWLHGQGVPQAKLVLIPNAPGYPLAPAAAAAINAARDFAFDRRPLSVLFLGRFDRQKGVDRLQAIVAELEGAGRFDFTVVGKSIVDGDAEPPTFPPSVRLLPPADDEGALTKLYADADVLLLPSRFEGLPLTVLEAQRCGCVVIATDVGALGEAVVDGKTGFLLRETNAVAEMTEILRRLAADPQLLRRVSKAAADKHIDWRNSTANLIHRIRAAVSKRRNGKRPHTAPPAAPRPNSYSASRA